MAAGGVEDVGLELGADGLVARREGHGGSGGGACSLIEETENQGQVEVCESYVLMLTLKPGGRCKHRAEGV